VIGTYAATILICAASIILGRGILALAGNDGSNWLGAAVGFAGLMIVCEVAIRLPGRAWTAVVVLILVCAASLWVARRGRPVSWPRAEGLVVGLVLLLVASVPFIANARVGVLGISFLNDTHWHLILAEELRRPALKALETYGPGYPLGPHAIATTFAQLLGSDVDKTLTSVLMATPILTGLTALAALRDVSRLRRWLVAVLAAFPYLAAAFYAESAFKEPILALILLGLVVAVDQGARERFARPLATLVPVAVLIAGSIYVYSYPGLVWPAAVLGSWVVLWLVLGGGWRQLRPVARELNRRRVAIAAGVGVLVVLVAPDIGRLHTFWKGTGGSQVGTVGPVDSSSLANLVGPLKWFEGLGIWLGQDFRVVPHDVFQAGAFGGLALVVLVFALCAALERRELAWLGGILGCGLVYYYARHHQSPYVAAKALVIATPLVALGSGRALMRPLDRARWGSPMTLGLAVISVVFFGAAFRSTYLVLRGAQVGPTEHVSELRSLRPLLHNRPTLVLFYDDYFKWELLGVDAATPLPLAARIPAAIQPEKPWTYGQAVDFDSVDAATLDRFDYVITTRTTAQSEPPSNFHVVGQSRSYEVWQRTGPTAVRHVLPESGQPGAVLKCETPLGRKVSEQQGEARVRQAPVASSPPAALQPGGSTAVVLKLPAGRWDVSLPYVSPQAVTVRGAGLDVRMPANLDRPGPLWPVGRVTSTGAPITLTLTMDNPSPIYSGDHFFQAQPLVAVPVAPAQTVPLSAACGRYVDWYVPRQR
jgi:hypothetical protein